MSGRRYIEMIKYTNARERFIPENELIVILTTMTNSFLQYTTTPEEYRIQRYEGGSTLFGVNQLKYYSFINKVRLDRNLTISQFH
jgi:neutral ceramidase